MKTFHTPGMIIRDGHVNTGGSQLHNREFHLKVALCPLLAQIDFLRSQ